MQLLWVGNKTMDHEEILEFEMELDGYYAEREKKQKSLETRKKNILFCVIKDNKKKENILNDFFYDIQKSILELNETGMFEIKKAILYSAKRFYKLDFDTCDQTQVYYCDPSNEQIEKVKQILVADALIREQMTKERDAKHILCILQDKEADKDCLDVDSFKILEHCFTQYPPCYSIFLLRNGERKGSLERMVENMVKGYHCEYPGEVFSFNEIDKVIARLKE